MSPAVSAQIKKATKSDKDKPKSKLKRVVENQGPNFFLPKGYIQIRVQNSTVEKASATIIKVSRKTLINESSYFRKLLPNISAAPSSEIECSLVYGEAILLKFASLINHPRRPRMYMPAKYSSSFWVDHAASVWFLAHEVGANNVEKYALSQFIQNCAIALFGPWTEIEEKAPKRSSLRNFSNHWIAWNFSLAGSDSNEYTGLKATSLIRLVTNQTRDPRTYDINHWFSHCAKHINPNCEHDPAYRRQIEFEATNITPQVNDDSGQEYESMIQSRRIQQDDTESE